MSDDAELVFEALLARKREKRITALRTESDRFRAALESIARQCVCRCEESWTSRGRHSPDCVGHVGDEARDALEGK